MIEQGAELVIDGRDFNLPGHEEGFFVGPHLFDHVTPKMDIYQKEIFFEKLSEISGTEEFGNKLDDLITVIDNEEIDEQKLLSTSNETFSLFNEEVSWREDANKNLLPELMKYNDIIKNNIGLRLQTRLTKEM